MNTDLHKDPHKPPLARLAELLGDSAHARLLQQRAQLLALRAESTAPQRREQYVRFRLGRDEEYGLPHCSVEEVLMVDGIARVPGTSPVWSGVINRRGQMLPVLDLSRLFGLDTEATAPGRGIGVVVVRGAGLLVGLRVDEPIDIDSYPLDALGPPLSVHGRLRTDYLTGLLHGRITLLDIDRILSDLCSGERQE